MTKEATAEYKEIVKRAIQNGLLKVPTRTYEDDLLVRRLLKVKDKDDLVVLPYPRGITIKDNEHKS